LVSSREEQWFRYERSVAQSIEGSLSTMQGVLEARVHLHLPESDPLFGTRRDDRGSGSLLMVVDSRFVAKDEELASLVAGAAGITATNVRVLRSVAPTAHGERPKQVTALAPQEVSPVAATHEEPRVASGEVSAPTDSVTMSHVEVGLASVAGIGVFALGAFVARRRKPRVTFTLPINDDGEEEIAVTRNDLFSCKCSKETRELSLRRVTGMSAARVNTEPLNQTRRQWSYWLIYRGSRWSVLSKLSNPTHWGSQTI
jgi:hypothetical protein